MGMWLLFLRTSCLEKKREVPFIVNGVPIRYSLEEFALMSGLYCHSYTKPFNSLGSTTFVGKSFGPRATIQYPDVEEKLMSMKKPSEARLRVAVLYFLCSVIIGKGKTGENAPSVEKFFLRVVADLELCKIFSWGRYAFDENVKNIFYLMDQCNGVVGPQKVFPSFVMPLESILTPTPDEKLRLERIMDVECGVNDVDDVIADGWKKRLVEEQKAICFELLFNEDVAHHTFVANKALSTVESDVRENELDEGIDANGGDKEREVGEKETEIDKEVAQDDSDVFDEVDENKNDVDGDNREMEKDKEVAGSEIGVCSGNKEMEKGKEVAESEIEVCGGNMEMEKDKEVPQDDEMDGGGKEGGKEGGKVEDECEAGVSESYTDEKCEDKDEEECLSTFNCWFF
uniref:Uncharacterized protein At2g06120 n=1 Tax=Arabidopsis thaliana TaxID=3702 RepID=Q9ZQ04_ARATH|nr:hypothetical protein [Arabidopsis thaliana]